MLSQEKKIPLDSHVYDRIKTGLVHRLFRPYATVLFCYSPLVGAWFALLSWFSPRTAFAGLFALICTWAWGRILSIKPPGDLHLVNGLLCGLFLSAYYPITPHFLIGLVMVCLFITISVNWFSTLLWNVGKIPLMSVPFVLGTWLLILIFQQAQAISFPALIITQTHLPTMLSSAWSNDFFSALGGLMLVPYPLTGALLFIGLFIASRYLAMLAIAGYIVGALMLYLLGYAFLAVETGYNFILVAIALGGIFIVPSLFSFFIALCGSALAALFVISLHSFLHPFNLPLLVMPFLLSTHFWLGGLGSRIDTKRGLLNLDTPVSPELSWERVRLERARGMLINSTFISHPFLGEWRIADDAETKEIYFAKTDQASSSHQQGMSDDKITAEQLIFAPVTAFVIEMRDSENIHYQKAAISMTWGNFLLMRDHLGKYIFLPHLKQGSIKPRPDEWVTLGQPIAACEKTNDSEYRFYIHVQKGVRPESDQLKFHLSNTLSYTKNKLQQFNLFYFPVAGDRITTTERDDALATGLQLQAALSLTYKVTRNKNLKKLMMLQTGVTPLGQTRLYAAKDCSVAYEEAPMSLVFYDRQGEEDILLDMWILALGLTPLTTQADCWYDKPALKYWPLSQGKRLLVDLFRPLGVGCESYYSRSWDETSKTWIQKAVHQAHILPGINWKATTSAMIDPKQGVVNIKLELFGQTWEATLESRDTKRS